VANLLPRPWRQEGWGNLPLVKKSRETARQGPWLKPHLTGGRQATFWARLDGQRGLAEALEPFTAIPGSVKMGKPRSAFLAELRQDLNYRLSMGDDR